MYYSNKNQDNDNRVWDTIPSSSLSRLSTGSAMSSVRQPIHSAMVSAIEPSVLWTSSRSEPSDVDWRTSTTVHSYSPHKVVEHNNSFNFEPKYNCDVNCNLNNYQSVSPTSNLNDDQSYGYSSCNDSNVNYIMEKLIESRDIVLREQSLEELKRQGVEVKQNFNFDIYLCKVCDECFQTMESALDHTKSIEHFDLKSGKFADELDRSLVIPTDKLTDIRIVLLRKQELKKLDLKTKYEFLRHGIRIKDGVGTDAYVCLECKVSFMSFNYVRHHLSKFKGYPQQTESEAVYSSNTFQGPVNGVRPPSPWRQSQRSASSQPSGSGSQINRSSGRSSKRRRRMTEKRKLNPISRPNPKPESEATLTTPRRRRRRNRTRNRNRNRRQGSNERNRLNRLPKVSDVKQI